MSGCIKSDEDRKSDEIDKILKKDGRKWRKENKILLMGTGESGKTTMLKQMTILHTKGYSDEDKINIIPVIKNNIHESIYSIVNSMNKLDPCIVINDLVAREKADYILAIGKKGLDEYTDEYYDNVDYLWRDPDVQISFQRANEYQLIDCAEYFLTQINKIRGAKYVPDIQDLLFSRVMTTAISERQFEVAVPRIDGGGRAKFRMIDVGGQRDYRKQWVQVFEGITAVLFIIAASDFDQKLREDVSVNRLSEALDVFRDMYWSRFLRSAPVILFLNKQDVLARKIQSGHDIGQYFPEYYEFKELGMDQGLTSESELVRSFIKYKVLETVNQGPKGTNYPREAVEEAVKARPIHIHETIATDTKNIKKIFDSVRNIIIKLNIAKMGL